MPLLAYRLSAQSACGSQFWISRGSQSPRSRSRIFLPVGARAQVTVPPPAPEPMTMTSACSVMVVSDRCVSGDGQRCHPGPRGAAQLGVADDEQELTQPGRGGLGQPQVLQHDDAVPDVERLRDDEGLGGILGWDGPVAPGVAAGQRDAV